MQASESSEQDWRWIREFQAGSGSSFRNLFDKYKTTVINLAFRFVRNQSAAEDIAQDVFIRIYEKKVSVDPKARFSTWLYRVTVNASLDFLRKNKNRPLSLDETLTGSGDGKNTLLETLQAPESSSPAAVMEIRELQRTVQAAIHDLPAKLRFPILLYQFQEMSYKEIAAILRISEKAVERRLYQAKTRLRSKLEKYFQTMRPVPVGNGPAALLNRSFRET